jgi:hypothetical protein
MFSPCPSRLLLECKIKIGLPPFISTSFPIKRSRVSSVGIAVGYGSDGRIQFPVQAIDFYLLHSFQTGSEAHPGLFPLV